MEISEFNPGKRQLWLGTVLAVLTVIGYFVLSSIIWTLFFAGTLIYVLQPAQRTLERRGLSKKVSAAVLTTASFGALMLFVAPLAALLYRRRTNLITFLENLPESFSFSLLGVEYVFQTSEVVSSVRDIAGDVALEAASAAPVVLLKGILVAFVVFAVLAKQDELRRSILGVFPSEIKQSVLDYNSRIQGTLYGLYIVQAATAFGTFIFALPLYFLFGYQAFFTLAAISGLLQFLPVVGPSVVVAVLTGFEVVSGNPTRAILMLVFGLTVIGLLPDAIVRPRFARTATGLSASLYFLGFIGGVLSVGAVGIIAGPLVIALIAETVEQLSGT